MEPRRAVHLQPVLRPASRDLSGDARSGNINPAQPSERRSKEHPNNDHASRTRLPSYLQPLFHVRSARPSMASSGLGSDVSGNRHRHLEASRHIFSSQCKQNRHQSLKRRCKLYFPKDNRQFNTKQNGGAERDRTADPLLAKQVLSQLSYSPNLSIICQTTRMVGPGRLELPTSRLSGVRSNHLSYGPILVARTT